MPFGRLVRSNEPPDSVVEPENGPVQVNEYGGVPATIVAVALPSSPQSPFTPTTSNKLACDSNTVIVIVTIQPLASVTLMVYVPGGKSSISKAPSSSVAVPFIVPVHMIT